MLPNLLSSTMNLADLLGRNDKSNGSKNQNKTEEQNLTKVKEEKSPGRPEKSDD